MTKLKATSHEIHLLRFITALFARPDHKILGVALARSGPAGRHGPGLFSFGQHYQQRRGVRFVQKQQRVLYRDLMRGAIFRAGVALRTTRAWRVRSSEITLVDTEFLARYLARAVTCRRARKSD